MEDDLERQLDELDAMKCMYNLEMVTSESDVEYLRGIQGSAPADGRRPILEFVLQVLLRLARDCARPGVGALFFVRTHRVSFCVCPCLLPMILLGTGRGRTGSHLEYERLIVLRGSVSAPGARRASFLTRAPPVTF